MILEKCCNTSNTSSLIIGSGMILSYGSASILSYSLLNNRDFIKSPDPTLMVSPAAAVSIAACMLSLENTSMEFCADKLVEWKITHVRYRNNN